jgi:hypothetical protein
MSDRITISPEAIEAAAKAAWKIYWPGIEWETLGAIRLAEMFREMAAASLSAGLAAWPRMEIERFAPWSKDRTIHLPMPREARDE